MFKLDYKRLKIDINEIVQDALNRQQAEYMDWLNDGCQMASPSSWVGATADEVAFEVTEMIKEKINEM